MAPPEGALLLLTCSEKGFCCFCRARSRSRSCALPGGALLGAFRAVVVDLNGR